MARLEAVYAGTLDKSAIEKVSRCNSKARLVADPYITVSQIQRVIENYMDHMKTNDFWTLVAPPASLAVANWQTPPNPSWLSKVLPLLYDFLEFATKHQVARDQGCQSFVCYLLEQESPG